jgi:transcriptional regulator with XRE-family HTH domain
MKSARILGNYVQKLAAEQNVTIPELSALMNCSEQQVKSFFKGRFFASFRQLQILAHKFGIKVSELIQGDESYYNKTVVDCMEDFQNPEARESILDIIDDFMDIQNALI